MLGLSRCCGGVTSRALVQAVLGLLAYPATVLADGYLTQVVPGDAELQGLRRLVEGLTGPSPGYRHPIRPYGHRCWALGGRCGTVNLDESAGYTTVMPPPQGLQGRTLW